MFSYSRCTRIFYQTRIRLSLYSYCKSFSKNTTRSFDAASFAITSLSRFVPPLRIAHLSSGGLYRFRPSISLSPLTRRCLFESLLSLWEGRVVAVVSRHCRHLYSAYSSRATRYSMGDRLEYSPSLSFIFNKRLEYESNKRSEGQKIQELV